ncbi:HlyD family efflux transporter periplasmic adaptor subunit [Romeria aff. gracilis LEGE 07310]|uniref:HlyD family efflux transporter periplasmic adaptor subunit n=1 Tax=Vasconcelosia minhoensis LEGE 07310 TaxID=915328 RepID=A0A8J7DQY9_9CYAN|nr:HlyD family efflux transporter periplasmic adaptor subunit [Romeria gracilis]MBE9077389.1 HlyD family efflux transporter periplasmic adaptor subunit [Romeria aff. gracilis LEGE 07310]
MTQTFRNGHSTHGTNGASGSAQADSPTPNVVSPIPAQQPFEQPVILRQSPKWSRAIVYTLIGVTVASVTWAFVAQVEETVPAQGKLEPEGVVQQVQAPVGGVIEEILVEEGEVVEAGQPVATLDQTAAQAELQANREIRQRLTAENDYYRAILAGQTPGSVPSSISVDLLQGGRDRAELQASNRVYRAQISGNTEGLSPEQVERFRAAQSRLGSQQNINALQASQYREQLAQTQAQLENANSELAINQDILGRYRRLNEEGAVEELAYLQQQQEVSNSRTRVNTLREELDRLRFQIAQAEQEVTRTGFESAETLQERIAVNNQKIAEIDSQLTQRIIQNDQQVEELNSQISQLEQTLKYQVLKSPVDGTVFNLKANRPGYVANTTEPILEIVPLDSLVARVYIPNKDIGFVKIGQEVDVRIDAFPYSEFGDVDGEIVSIGSDALPPDEVFQFYRFPAEIDLNDQTLLTNGQDLELRSGMSVSASIKLRKRRVITFFTDLFVRKRDNFTSGG